MDYLINWRVYLILSYLGTYLTELQSFNGLNFERNKRQTTIYRESEFLCKNGQQQIDKSLVCDGVKDCVDGSDETWDQCGNTTCPSYVYKCAYGACVPQKAKCDGRIDCVDQSDESPFVCDFQIPQHVNVCRENQYQCFSEQCIDIKQFCDGKKDCKDGSDETYIRCHNKLCNIERFFQCEYGACVDKSYRCDGTRQCVDGSDESTRTCKVIGETTEHTEINTAPADQKKCDKLTPVNVDLKCYRNGSLVNCNADLVVGTKVRPICKPFHTYKDLVPVYQEITCQQDGTWDYKLFSCIYECGRPYVIFNTTSEFRVESPWHVAVYDRNKILICSGTIISPYLILTAAHCFGSQIDKKEDYEIVVSKATKNYSTIDNGSQKAYKVKEIRLYDQAYVGGSNYFVADIAVMITREKIQVEVAVQPACVDWIRTRKYQPPEGTPGKLLGWETDPKANDTENYLIRFLSFASRDRCLRRVTDDFKPYLTSDKFCATSDDGSNDIPRSTGSGLLFREGSHYLIRGILSFKPSTDRYLATFTDLAPYVSWILQVRNEVELKTNKIR